MEELPLGARVLVCGDLFDADNTHWQQSIGFGQYIDTDPPAKTVYFEAKVTRHLDDELKKRVYTSKFCRECKLEPRWTYATRTGESFKCYAPRLCSTKCWDDFHSAEIFGLDHHQRNRKRTRAVQRRARASNSSTPQPVRRANRQAGTIQFDV